MSREVERAWRVRGMRTATAQKKMKKKKVQSSNGFESSADITIDVRHEFEERRRTYQEKKGSFSQ